MWVITYFLPLRDPLSSRYTAYVLSVRGFNADWHVECSMSHVMFQERGGLYNFTECGKSGV
jgi:hypothetical protein